MRLLARVADAEVLRYDREVNLLGGSTIRLSFSRRARRR
jgi:hypothetical protein